MNENGLLSFDGLFFQPVIQDFDDFFHFPILAPLWTDIDIQSGGSVLFREDSDPDTLERASNLTEQLFRVSFEPSTVIVITWLDVPSVSNSNTPDSNLSVSKIIRILYMPANNGHESIMPA